MLCIYKQMFNINNYNYYKKINYLENKSHLLLTTTKSYTCVYSKQYIKQNIESTKAFFLYLHIYKIK